MGTKQRMRSGFRLSSSGDQFLVLRTRMGCLRSFLSGLVGLPRVGAATAENSSSPPILFPFLFLYFKRSHCSPDLKFKDPLAAASQVLGLEVCTASPGLPTLSRLVCSSLFWLLTWFLHLHPLSRILVFMLLKSSLCSVAVGW